jgi:hypothetical protein
MTHIENIPHILMYGITNIQSPHSNPEYVPIGDGSLISSRSNFDISNGKKLGEYIPFYFGVRMPMLFVIQKGYNGVKVTRPEEVVYCVSSVQRILDNKLDFVFSDGHAVDRLSTIYYPKDAKTIDIIIDKKAIESKYWKDDNDLDLKRRKEAEFLIAEDIPVKAILGYYVYNSIAKETLLEAGVNEKNVIISPDCYF